MSGPPVTQAAPGHLEAVLSLYRHLHEADQPVPPELQAQIWTQMMDNPAVTVLLAWQDGQPAATCLLVMVPNLTRGGRPWAMIENVVTHPDYRGRGFGKAVLAAAVERARLQGCYKVMLMTGRSDPGTLSFYEKAGFVRGDKTGFIRRL